MSRSPMRGVCVIPRCGQVGPDRRSILCAEHWAMVPAHLQKAQQAARRGGWRTFNTRDTYLRWYNLSLECVRYVLVALWGDVFAQPPGHTWWGGECWCFECAKKREDERPHMPPAMAEHCRPCTCPLCTCPLCTQARALAPRALDNRRCIHASKLPTDGDRRVAA